MNNTLRIALMFAGALAVWLFFDGVFDRTEPGVDRESNTRTVHFENVSVAAAVADTDAARMQGLSGRERLESDSGLLFVFDRPDTHGIWMKDMEFPIDIIWIAPFSDTSSSGGGSALRVVDIKHGATPESFPEVFQPRENATHVLEVNAGFADLHGISVGDRVYFSE